MDAWVGAVKALGDLVDAVSGRRTDAESSVEPVRLGLAQLEPMLRSEADRTAHAVAVEALEGDRGQWPSSLEQAYRQLRVQAVRHSPAARALPRRVSSHNPHRSAFHAAAGLCAALVHRYLLTPDAALAVAVGLSGVGLALELTRRQLPSFNRSIMASRFVRRVSRAHEHRRIWSSTYFAWGVTATMLFAPPVAVQLACVVLAFGDPSASIVGRHAGGPKLLEAKSLGGSLGFVGAGTAFGFAFLLLSQDLSFGTSLVLAGVASLAGAVAELFSKTVDDNLTIPIAAGLAATLLLASIQ